MFTPAKTLTAIALTLATFSAPAFADTYHHIDLLALKIAQQSQQLVHESRHYRHTAEYAHLVDDAVDMAELADHLHEVAHHHGSLSHMRSDVAQLDAKFHHLESVFDRAQRRAAYGHGHVHGDTRHVRALLCAIEDNIHHLQDDLRSLSRPVHPLRPAVVARPPVYVVPQYGVQHHNHFGGHRSHDVYRHRRSSGRGITIGGGSSRFTIRF